MKYGLFLLMKMKGRVVILWMRVGLSYYVLIFYKKNRQDRDWSCRF
jgi:hypothetical protein